MTTNDKTRTYVARLVVSGVVHQTIEFEATDDRQAWREANDGIDPLLGQWVEVKRKREPQIRLEID